MLRKNTSGKRSGLDRKIERAQKQYMTLLWKMRAMAEKINELVKKRFK